MINTITVTNHRSESVVLDLRNPAPSGFFIRGVDGLGPTKATINTSQSLSKDGSTFNSARQEQRNIVFKLGFLENPTIEHSRQNSYKYFPLKRPVLITIATDNKIVRTRGYVESNEPDIFSKDSGNVVSIICPDPYFYGTMEEVVYFSAVTGLFEFPFSNESLTLKLIEFGSLSTEPQQNIVYNGEVSVGFRMYLTFDGLVENITIYNISTGQMMIIDTDILTALMGAPIEDGDQIIISTVKGDKTVTFIHSGISYNILNALGPDSDWFTLEPGDNIFYYTAEAGEANVTFEIRYDILYEGI